MTRGVWVIRDNELVLKQFAPPLKARSDLPSPMIISDTMEYTLNHADGRKYGSKRAFEKAVRAAGCEIIGNEKPSPIAAPQMDDPVNDIKAAIEQVESRAPKAKRKRRSKRGI